MSSTVTRAAPSQDLKELVARFKSAKARGEGLLPGRVVVQIFQSSNLRQDDLAEVKPAVLLNLTLFFASRLSPALKPADYEQIRENFSKVKEQIRLNRERSFCLLKPHESFLLKEISLFFCLEENAKTNSSSLLTEKRARSLSTFSEQRAIWLSKNRAHSLFYVMVFPAFSQEFAHILSIDDLIISYKFYMSTLEFFEALRSTYCVTFEFEESKKLKEFVVNTLISWLQSDHGKTLLDEAEIKDAFNRVLHQMEELDKALALSKQDLNLLVLRQRFSRATSRYFTIQTILLSEQKSSFLNLYSTDNFKKFAKSAKPLEIATEIKLAFCQIISKITLSQFFSRQKPDAELQELIEVNKGLTTCVRNIIFNGDKKIIFKLLIQIASSSLQINDFNMAFLIYSALNVYDKDGVLASFDSKTTALFNELHNLFKPEKNYAVLRSRYLALEEAKEVFVPFLEVVFGDLTHIEELPKAVLVNKFESYSPHQCFHLSKALKPFYLLKNASIKTLYPINSDLVDFLKNAPILPKDSPHKGSQEPTSSSSSSQTTLF